ncbi:MAG TPA: ABC transporter ATP-binding protein [Alphaproteobacteria bacterium]|nr:ABC transporter ATP-binding protein [Alphaproteobacteria bacterium]HAJ48307.1 ABC transporter ATP-binding protein [Alphaproteobacteria bacterium]
MFSAIAAAPARYFARLWPPPPKSGDDDGMLAELVPVKALPRNPVAFVIFVVRHHFAAKFWTLVALVAIATTIEAFAPFVLKNLINTLNAAQGTAEAAAAAQDVMLWFLAFGFVWYGSSLFIRAAEAVDIAMSPRMRGQVQNYLFGYLLGHSPRYFQENFAGKLGQKVKQAGQTSIGVLQMVWFETTRLLVLMVVGGALLFAQHPFYAVVLGGWTIIYLVSVAMIARHCVTLSKALSDEVSTSTGRLIDAIGNADLIRAFAKREFERRFLGRFLADEQNASKRLRWFLIFMRVFMATMMLVLLMSLLYLGIHDTLAGVITVGGFTMVFILGTSIARTVQELSYRLLDFFEQIGTLTEALELVTTPHEIADKPGAKPLALTAGRIEFQDIDFAHGDGYPVFRGLNLIIQAGEKVGLVGPSGAGKSTLVKLLRRQFEPQAGQVLIDGQNVQDVTWDSLNESIAEVPQTPGVFHRPVRDNIRYARPEAEEEDVVRAALDAHAHDFISKRPTGYDTIVGEQGIKLSGGERQRVAIARALVKDARILVLDEATSSLDSESEHLIQEALWTLMQGRTVIAIAHRLSTIAGMDRIVYLDGGRIVEQGPHDELLARGGAYAKLWNRQMGGFIDAA